MTSCSAVKVIPLRNHRIRTDDKSTLLLTVYMYEAANGYHGSFEV